MRFFRDDLIRQPLCGCHLPLKGKAYCTGPKAFPFRGRWHGEAVSDEVVSPTQKTAPERGQSKRHLMCSIIEANWK